MPNSNLAKELKALGSDVMGALREMRKSKEFKKLERDLVRSFKSVTASVKQAAVAAKKSKSTAKIKNRLGRVVKAGKVEGAVQAKRAEVIAGIKLRQARAAFKKISKKIKDR